MLNKRTQILFEDNIWLQLCALAKAKETSVGDLVRKAVKKTYCDDSREQTNREAIDHILSIRKKFKKINYQELINYGRKY